jgi:hypothetical protein
MNAVCQKQAALTPSITIAPIANPDDVELGMRELAEGAAGVAAPSGDTAVSAAQGRLNDAADAWLALAQAASTSAAAREAATEQIRTAVAALTTAGAVDCERLSPRPFA